MQFNLSDSEFSCYFANIGDGTVSNPQISVSDNEKIRIHETYLCKSNTLLIQPFYFSNVHFEIRSKYWHLFLRSSRLSLSALLSGLAILCVMI